jgi:predicted regulator of Ras-like GTPase activity (Roadblock/LC7/MglB family)
MVLRWRMATKEEELKKILDEFESTGEVIGSAVVRRDGLMVISSLPNDVNSKAVAAMAAAIVGTGETASKELDMGNLNQIVVESAVGKLISVGAGDEVIFTVLVKAKANMGLILMAMERTAKKIATVIG